ncbi:aldehyde dehydrogenase family protein [Mycolicibacterium helvum]|uniref:Aldehyde dehydrogenase n=1 Tax=Mycolicibacterium helvum TaxID=1534349 RepID=A0A7I7TAN3_9MYCO|nr:aldehyde dehydrogenase family protein [Mycolicibacterium helvum]BBY65509.1 aldehyde dehydrogenase [Mycolicibacterium helvum]
MTNTLASDVLAVGDVAMLINGMPYEAAAGWIEVESPRDGTVLGRVPRAGEAEIDAAIQAARSAQPAWSDFAPRARGAVFRAIADALEPEVEYLARLCSAENGNALRTQTRGEAAFVVDCFRFFSGLAQEAKGETIPINLDVLDYSRREPLGVVGAIIPWNAPLMLAAVKIAPALLMGNTMVLKTAEDAPFAVLKLAEICQRHLPHGVLNVVTGFGPEAGEALTAHPGVDKLSFTGSTAVGRRIMTKAADRIVPVSLELGGKNPQIVYPDSDDDDVVNGVVSAMRFFRQGQSCTAGSRLFLHRSIADSFTDKLLAAIAQFRVGDPLDETSDIGSIVNRKQYERVCGFIAEGIDQPGATLLAGGLPDGGQHGFYVQPTVFADVQNSWRIAREEIFGPVLCIIPWDDEDDVIAMANDSHYGLSAFIWSKGIATALRTAHRLQAGWVQINQGGGQALGQSYGGVKQSGIGAEFSLEGMLDSYTRRKHISVRIAQ